ncbi:MAG: class I SAM-dependent methyltransferase [Steroidobacteraceae bacterium]|nr:class I SAM-dependent methyltransferase [Steroidobacteraceae bacterium]
MSTKPSIIPSMDGRPREAERAGPIQALGRRVMLGHLRHLDHGCLSIVENGERHVFGQPTARCALSPVIEVDHPQFWADVAFGGTVGAGESYIRGDWRCSDLTALVRLMVVNRDVMDSMDSGYAFVSAPLRRLLHWANRNSPEGSKRNIAAHYDLGNDLFRLFLDETMAYSCGIFETPQTTLHEASVAKFDAACRKLDLKPGERLVEIGTGWGGLAVHAAKHYGVHVTTTTISKEQHAWASELVAREGLGDRITLLTDDYRELAGRFDKLVSIEMIEAVGHQFLDTYIAKCSSLLEHHGAALIQAITLQDQIYESALKQVDYIQRFVFPGSFIPSVTAIVDAARRSTDMKLFNLEDIGPHYATTLRHWRERFMARLPEVRALGYPEQFVRLWEFYLCYCEGGFEERQIGDAQLLFTKPGCRRPPIASLRI